MTYLHKITKVALSHPFTAHCIVQSIGRVGLRRLQKLSVISENIVLRCRVISVVNRLTLNFQENCKVNLKYFNAYSS